MTWGMMKYGTCGPSPGLDIGISTAKTRIWYSRLYFYTTTHLPGRDQRGLGEEGKGEGRGRERRRKRKGRRKRTRKTSRRKTRRRKGGKKSKRKRKGRRARKKRRGRIGVH